MVEIDWNFLNKKREEQLAKLRPEERKRLFSQDIETGQLYEIKPGSPDSQQLAQSLQKQDPEWD